MSKHNIHDACLIDPTEIQLIPALFEDYPTIQNMGRFYVYDMSEYMGQEKGWEIPNNEIMVYMSVSILKNIGR